MARGTDPDTVPSSEGRYVVREWGAGALGKA